MQQKEKTMRTPFSLIFLSILILNFFNLMSLIYYYLFDNYPNL